jgi:DNA-directed RNA polymerase alpha subunit
MRSVARRSREAEPPRDPDITEPKPIALGSPVEDLGLSVRTRNALRGIGCDTVEDLLGLEFSSPVRGVGRKTREELLTTLERAGFRHPAVESEPASEEMRILESSLERMQGRVEAALGAVAREIRLIKQGLRKLANKRAD